MIEQIKKFLIENKLQNEKILVAFSGGYDSMCLLHALIKITDKKNLLACHINHNWRGKESLEDERKCKEFCEKNKVEFICKTLDKNCPQTEEFARKIRYELFEETAKKNNINAIFTAHTKSDNVETLVYRLIKGTGIKGLISIPKTRKLDNTTVYRPLLNFSREEIEEYCKDNQLTPNVDSSNFDEKYQRNFIRQSILPNFKKINKEYENNIDTLSKIAQEQQSIVQEYLTKISTELFEEDKILTNKFLNLSKETQKQIIYNFVTEKQLDYDHKKICEIHDFITKNQKSKSGKTLSLTKNLWLFVSNKEIYTIKTKKEEPETSIIVEKEGDYKFNDKIISIKKHSKSIKDFPKENEHQAYVDLSEIEFPLILKYREEKDVIQPFGMKETIKFKKYLINKSIPNHKKRCIILLCKGSEKKQEILWAVSVGLSEKLRTKNNSPTHILSIKDKEDE